MMEADTICDQQCECTATMVGTFILLLASDALLSNTYLQAGATYYVGCTLGFELYFPPAWTWPADSIGFSCLIES